MRDGVAFLHRLLLTLLLWMKDDLMAEGEEDSVLLKMGGSYVREMGVDWQEVIRTSGKV